MSLLKKAIFNKYVYSYWNLSQTLNNIKNIGKKKNNHNNLLSSKNSMIALYSFMNLVYALKVNANKNKNQFV